MSEYRDISELTHPRTLSQVHIFPRLANPSLEGKVKLELGPDGRPVIKPEDVVGTLEYNRKYGIPYIPPKRPWSPPGWLLASLFAIFWLFLMFGISHGPLFWFLVFGHIARMW